MHAATKNDPSYSEGPEECHNEITLVAYVTYFITRLSLGQPDENALRYAATSKKFNSPSPFISAEQVSGSWMVKTEDTEFEIKS